MAVTPGVSIRIGVELKEFRAALNQVRADMSKLAQQGRRTSDAMGGANTGIGQIAGTVRTASTAVKQLIGGLVALQGVRLFFGLVQQGIEFNKTLETAELGIASLIAAQSDLVDAQGKAVKGQDALTVAIDLSKQQMRELRIAGLQTAATTTQLVEAFQQAVGPGLTAGLNLDEVRAVTVQIVQAAGALGVPMNQIAQEVRAILDGTIDINARVAKSLGITNEQVNTWKQQGTLVAELNKRMSAFADAGARAADTFEVIKSNTQEAFESVAGELTTGYFDKIKAALKDATSGIFDTKTLGISEAFRDLASLTKEIIDLVGDGVAGAIRGVMDLAEQFSGYIRANREDLSELVQSAGMLLDQFSQLVGAVLEIVVGIGDAGVKTSIFAKIIQTIAVLIAGVRDGFRAIGAVVTWLGSLIIKVVLAPLETLMAILSEVVGIANKEAAAKLKNVEKQIAGISKRGFEAASDLMAPIADGTGAVATAIKDLDRLKTAAAKAGNEQKKAAGGATGSATGSKGGAKTGKFSLPDLQKEVDQSFRLVKDALDRESRALDQALEDRRISIADWYAEKDRAAEDGFANERARLDRERAQLADHLARLTAAAGRAGKAEDRQRAEKEIASTKSQVAKIDADLIILERERASVIGKLANDAAQKEKEYRAAIEETRVALLRAQGKELDARLAEIETAYRNAQERFRGDTNALSLVDQLFNAQTAKAKIDDLQGKVQNFFSFYAEAERQAAARVELGSVTRLDAERELQDLRSRSIAQIREYIASLEALAETSNDPELLQKIGAVKIQLQQIEATQPKFITDLKQAGQTGLASFFNDLATGAKTFGDALRDLVRTFAQAVARMAAEALAADIMGKLFKKPSGGGAGGGFDLFGWVASLFHTGGVVGRGGGMRRAVNPLVFAGAPRYHGGGVVGLKPNEVPAILEKGETVRTQKQEAALQRGGGYRIVNVVDPSLVNDYMTSSAGEQVILNTIGRNPGYVKQLLGA